MLTRCLQTLASNFANLLIILGHLPIRQRTRGALRGARQPKRRSGQAVVELAFALPILVLLIAYTLNSYLMMHTAHVGQKYVVMNLLTRVNSRAQLVIDDVDGAGGEVTRGFMAVQAVEDGQAPRRRIVLSDRDIVSIMGICREPSRQRCR